MAKSNDELLKELQAEREEWLKERQELNAEKEKVAIENEKLKAAIDASEVPVAKPIPGKFTAEWKSPAGNTVKKVVRFKDGHRAVRLNNGSRVDSAGLIKLANDGAATKEQLANSPALANLTQQDAKDYLTHLVQIKYGYLEETK